MQQKFVVEMHTDEKVEKILRNFLLRNSNILRLTAVKWIEVSWLILWRRKGGDNDPLFKKTKERLQKYFLKKIINNKRFDDVVQRKKARYEHYFYKLSANLRKSLNEETLFWPFPPESSKNFYGFEDSTFYRDGHKLGCVISHENYVFLYLTPSEKKQLERLDIKLTKVSE